MVQRPDPRTAQRDPLERGFTIIELMIAMLLLMVVSATVLKGVTDLSLLHSTISNRTQMHAGVRNATELLTQEVGQAGKIALPAAVTVAGATAVNATTVTLSSTQDMFVGEFLLIDTGASSETAAITGINGNQITVAALTFAHAAGAPVTVPGGFAAGVIPPSANAASASTLKIFGDLNSDGRMQYVEYVCDTNAGRLYRNAMAFNVAPPKAAPTIQQVLIDNILPNPGGTPCFTYQTQSVNGTDFVTDVAITLTVQTQNRDRITGAFQTETKALLNVSPRNVFNVWQLAGLGTTNRVQPTPATVTALIP